MKLATEGDRGVERDRAGDSSMKSPLKLNAEQQQAIASMKEFINSGEKFFLLQGYAGTGKTTTIQSLIKDLRRSNRRLWVAFTAPTNKAVKVLRCMAAEWHLHNIDFMTVHQILGLKLKHDGMGGEKLSADGRAFISSYELVVVDEASMISQQLWSLLTGSIEKYPKVKIIFMGDPAQLPPVNEEISQVFDIPNQAVLAQVMRQGNGNPVGNLVNEIRERIDNQKMRLRLLSHYPDKSQGVWVLPTDTWMGCLIRGFQSEESQANPDHIRALAWTNKKVSWLNTEIRKGIYGPDAAPFMVGERLIAKSSVFNGEEIIMPTSTECLVTDATLTYLNGYRCWELEVTDDVGEEHRIYVIHDESRSLYEHDLQNINGLAREAVEEYSLLMEDLPKKSATWDDYFELKCLFAPMDYAYALTVHKSQGSTFENVMVDSPDIMRNPKDRERHQCLYVACSRAAKRLLIAS